MTARLQHWYRAHPRVGKPALVVAVVQLLSVVATCTAPQATAATNTVLLNFTGLTDSYGVPIGSYYLSVASLTERISQAGPDLSINPDSWGPWMMDSLAAMLTQFSSSIVLTALASLYIGVIALALWIFKITVSSYWLIIIGEIARTISTALITVTAQLGVLLICVPLGVFIGVMTIKRGESGRGWMMILITLGLPTVSVAVFYDPAGVMYGPSGVLQFARDAGFSVASAATNNGATGIEGTTSALVTQIVREPLQLWNFGQVVDRVGGCGPAWSQAMMQPRLDPLGNGLSVTDAAIRAMESCGNESAVSYAQHLDNANVWLGVVFCVCSLVFGFFMVACGWAVLKVSVKAIWTTVIIVPTLWVGSVPGAPQRRAAAVTWEFFQHGLEVLAYIVFVSVIGQVIQRIVSAPLPDELGGSNPVAHVLIMAACALAGWYLLNRVKAEFEGHSGGGTGLMGRASGTATGMAMHGGMNAAGKGAKGLGSKLFSGRGGGTPWDRQDAKAQPADTAGNASAVHGPPKPGFDPITKSAGGPNPSGGPAGGAMPAGGGIPADPASAAGGAQGGAAQSQVQTAATTALAAKTGGTSVAVGRGAKAVQGAASAGQAAGKVAGKAKGQGGGPAQSSAAPSSGTQTAAGASDQPRQLPPISTDQRHTPHTGDQPRSQQTPTADQPQPRPPTPPPHKVEPITRDEGGDRR